MIESKVFTRSREVPRALSEQPWEWRSHDSRAGRLAPPSRWKLRAAKAAGLVLVALAYAFLFRGAP